MLSIIIPAYNEEKGLEEVLKKLENAVKDLHPCETIVVDDASTDGTKAIAQQFPFVKVISHPVNRGYGRSLSDGIKTAKGESIAILDADGTYPIEELLKLFTLRKEYDMVIGARQYIHYPKFKYLKLLARGIVHLLASFLSGHKIPDINCGLRIFKKSLWEKHKDKLPEGFSFTTSLTMATLFTGGTIRFEPIQYLPRFGESKVNFLLDGCKLIARMLKLTFLWAPERLWIPLILLSALLLRFWGLDYGLPSLLNSDEPHFINHALMFSRGDLNPHIFKYPSLWMYLLMIAYGLVFVIWSGFGLLRETGEFALLFFQDPSLFYWTARFLSAAAGTGTIWLLYLIGKEAGSKRLGIISAAFLGFSPPLVLHSHYAKPDSLMILLACLGILKSVQYIQKGKSFDFVLSGIFFGFAISTQYTAGPLALLVPLSFFLRSSREGTSYKPDIKIILGILAIPLAFIAGSPYTLLDFPTFYKDLLDLGSYASGELLGSTESGWLKTLKDLSLFGSLSGVIGLAGAIFLSLNRRRWGGSAWIFALPPLLYLILLGSIPSTQSVGQYVYPSFPALAICAGTFIELILVRLRQTPWKILTLIIVFLPSGVHAWIASRNLNLPDTRTISSDWIAQNIPPGNKILLDDFFVCPQLKMHESQLKRLHAKTEKANHPRKYQFQKLLEHGPRGGYDIWHFDISAGIIGDMPRKVKESKIIKDLYAASGELLQAKKEGFQWIVLSSWGAYLNKDKDIRLFRENVRKQMRAHIIFPPRRGKTVGPKIEIYKIETNTS